MNSKKYLPIIFVTSLIDMIGFGIIIPILPYFAERYGADGFIVGLLTSVYLIVQFIFTPVWGVLSDRIGRRPVILICIFATGFSYILFGLADSLALMFVARIVGGAFAGKFTTIQAYIADVTTRENRSKGMGLFGAAFGLGFILGPVIGGILGQYGFQAPLFFAAGLALLNGAAAWFILPESLSDEAKFKAKESREENRLSAENILQILKTPLIGVTINLSAIYNFAFSMLYATFALFMERRFQFHTRETGYIFGFLGVVSAAIQGGLIGRISKWVGEEKMIIWGILVNSAGLLLLAASDRIAGLLISVTIMAIGGGIITPALSGLVSKKTSEAQQGRNLGLMQSFSNLARMFGLILGGYVFEALGIASPYWISGMILLAGFLYSLIALKNNVSVIEKT